MSNESDSDGIGITDVDKRTGLSCIDIIEHVPFNIGIAMGNLWRCGLRCTRGEHHDLQLVKASIWRVERELARCKADADQPQERMWIPKRLEGKREGLVMYFPHWVAGPFNSLWSASFYDPSDRVRGDYLPVVEELDTALFLLQKSASMLTARAWTEAKVETKNGT